MHLSLEVGGEDRADAFAVRTLEGKRVVVPLDLALGAFLAMGTVEIEDGGMGPVDGLRSKGGQTLSDDEDRTHAEAGEPGFGNGGHLRVAGLTGFAPLGDLLFQPGVA